MANDPNRPEQVIDRAQRDTASDTIFFPTKYKDDVLYGTVMRIEEFNFLLQASSGGAPTVVNQSDITAHIFLPLPLNITETLNHSYGGQDIALAIQGMQAGSAVAKGEYDEALSVLKGTALKFVRQVASGISPELGGAINAATGTVPNPFSVTLFERTNQRIHSFDWKLVPQNAADTDAAKLLIDTLRYYSLPRLEQAFLTFPHTFQIAFFGTDKLFGLTRCFLSSISVNYTPDATSAFFADTRGPCAINLSLTFMEIEPLSKNSLESGKYQPARFDSLNDPSTNPGFVRPPTGL